MLSTLFAPVFAAITLGQVLLVILILVLLGSLPGGPVVKEGYWPSGAIGILLVILIVLLLLGVF